MLSRFAALFVSLTLNVYVHFQFGLSYSSFEFRVHEASRAVRCGTQALVAHYDTFYAASSSASVPCARFDVAVQNTGTATSAIVVLGFLNSSHPDAPKNKELFSFVRMAALSPGEARTATLSVPTQVLSVVDAHGNERVRSGLHDVEFGVEGSAEGTPARASLEVEGDDVLLFSLPALERQHAQKSDDRAVRTRSSSCAVGESLGCLREGLPPGGFPGGFQGSCPIRGGPCGRCLPYFVGAMWVAQTSRENCACLCHRRGFALAGVENGANCYW